MVLVLVSQAAWADEQFMEDEMALDDASPFGELSRHELAVLPLPDLIIADMLPPVRVGNLNVARVIVRNIGRKTAASSKLSFRDNNFQSSQFRQIGTLTPGQQVIVSFNVSYPENQGPWYFSAFADFGNVVRESNENNNLRHLYHY